MSFEIFENTVCLNYKWFHNSRIFLSRERWPNNFRYTTGRTSTKIDIVAKNNFRGTLRNFGIQYLLKLQYRIILRGIKSSDCCLKDKRDIEEQLA